MTYANGNGNAYIRPRQLEDAPAPLAPRVTLTKKAKKPTRLSKKDEFELAKHLAKICSPPTKEYPYAKYADGQNDERVAEELGYSLHNVSKYRLEAIGALKVGTYDRKGLGPYHVLGLRIERLEADVVLLRERLNMQELARNITPSSSPSNS